MADISLAPRRLNFLGWLLSSVSVAGTLFVVVQLNLSAKSVSVEPFLSEHGWNPIPNVTFGGPSNISANEGMAACLLIMDDNHFLIEWLAYHFYYLPLRRLIVGIDPKSKTSPIQILNRYQSRGLINITLWNDEDFLPNETKTTLERFQTYLYLVRQEYFIYECLKTFKRENRTWMIYVDTDEFVLPNRDSNPGFHFDTRQKVYSILTNPPRNDFWTNITTKSPCHPIIRRDMGVKESPTDVIQRGVPEGFIGSDFLTYRFRWPQPYHTQQKPGKSFLDLSRVSWDDIHPSNTNPHRPLKNHCMPKAKYPGFPLPDRSPFLVYHYAGSYEQFSYRDDGRKSRTREAYNQRYFDFNSMADHGATFWLPRFVQEVGVDLAQVLLEGVGQLEPIQSSHVSRLNFIKKHLRWPGFKGFP